MPYVFNTTSDKLRILLSGLPNSGKTTSLQTFLFGPYNYSDHTQQADAVTYAAGKHMVIIVCPGEFGVRSLPEPSEYISIAYNIAAPGTDINSLEYSLDALSDFNAAAVQIVKNKPDIFCNDGVHALAANMMNKSSNGQYARGEDLNLNDAGVMVQYRAAKMYEQLRAAMAGYCSWLYNTDIPMIICTTWEDWKSGNDEVPGAAHSAADKRYLWPDIPGKTSKAIVGRFDMRLSCRIERRCIHNNCEFSKASEDHFVWQFLPRGDVAGVGIKGLKVHKEMMQRPYIHQNWHSLKSFMQRYV